MTAERTLKCFVLSPIGEDGSEDRVRADKVIKHLVRKALGPKYDVRRGDDETNPGAITPRIIASILEADLIVADLTGVNPNVFYELAIAHGYSRPTVHIQSTNEKIPFDVKDMRIVRYNLGDPDELEVAQKRLSESAKFAVTNPTEIETPLSSGQRFMTVADSTDPVAESNVRVMEAIERLGLDLKRAIRSSATHIPSAEEDQHRDSDELALKLIVKRMLRRKAPSAQDFDSVISPTTSKRFDDWAKETVGDLMPEMDPSDLNHLLMDDDMARLHEESLQDYSFEEPR